MTALEWCDVADLQPGDKLARIIGYSRGRHPSLATVARHSKTVRADVVSVEPDTHGATRVTFRVGTTTMSRTWIPATVVAIERRDA